MDITDQTEEPVRLSFTLTLLQRIFNPLYRLLFALLILVVLAVGFSSIIREPGDIFRWLATLLTTVVVLFFLGRHVYMHYLSVRKKIYINKLVIENETVFCYYNELQVSALRRGSMTVEKGLFGTTMIRYLPYGGHFIILPQSSIPFECLEKLLGRP
ncbi:MAG: hypothetical protein ACYC6A_00495 [Armatimonadota bacterium]